MCSSSSSWVRLRLQYVFTKELSQSWFESTETTDVKEVSVRLFCPTEPNFTKREKNNSSAIQPN